MSGDKIAHFFVSFMLTIIIAIIFNQGRVNIPIYISVLGIGLAKELYDMWNGGQLIESGYDMIANTIGVIVAALLLNL